MSFKDQIGKQRAVITDSSIVQPLGRRPFSEVRPYLVTRPGYREYDRLRLALGRHWFVRAGDQQQLEQANIAGNDLYVYGADINVYLKDFMRDPIEMYTRAAAGGTIAVFGNVALYGAGGAAGTGVIPGMAPTSYEPILEDRYAGSIHATFHSTFDTSVSQESAVLTLGFDNVLPEEGRKIFDNVVALFAEGKIINNYDSNGFSVPTVIPPLIRRDKAYLDMPFEYASPFSNIELNKLGSNVGTSFANVTTDFISDINYETYINTIEQLQTPETVLPSVYSYNFTDIQDMNHPDQVFVAQFQDNPYWDVNTAYNTHINNQVLCADESGPLAPYYLRFGFHFPLSEHIGSIIPSVLSERHANSPSVNSFKNIGFSLDAYNRLTPSEDQIRDFPMHAKIEMSAPYGGSMHNLLSGKAEPGPIGTQIFPALMQLIMAGTVLNESDIGSMGYYVTDEGELATVTPGYLFQNLPFRFVTTEFSTLLPDLAIGEDSPFSTAALIQTGMLQDESTFGFSANGVNLKVWNVENIIEAVIKNQQDLNLDRVWRPSSTGVTNLDNHTIFLTDDRDDDLLEPFSPESGQAHNSYKSKMVSILLRTLAQDKFRKYKELMGVDTAATDTDAQDYNTTGQGIFSHKELLMFKIEKQRYNEETGEYTTVQNIFLPNAATDEPGKDIVQYFDTQVHYDQLYRYRVMAYFIVVGTEYGYNRVRIETNYGPISREYDSETDSGIIAYTEDGMPVYGEDTGEGECVDGDEPCPDDVVQGQQSSPFTGAIGALVNLDLDAPVSFRLTGMEVGAGANALASDFIMGSYIQSYPMLFDGIVLNNGTLGPIGGYKLTNPEEYVLAEIELIGDYQNVLIFETSNGLQFFGKRIRYTGPGSGFGGFQVLPCVTREGIDNRVFAALPRGACPPVPKNFHGDALERRTVLLPNQQLVCLLKPDSTIQAQVEPEEEAEPEIQPADMQIAVRVSAYHKPKIHLVEVPYFNTDGAQLSLVLDKPPLAPDVNFIPQPGDRNTITFLFNRQAGIEELHPIVFGPGEEARYNRHRIAQGRRAGETITFSDDNANATYIVYRSTDPPASISALSRIGESNGTAYTDFISPNVKYYYVFRAQDIRDNLSYPTRIYEVELVTLEDGSTSTRTAVLPLIKEYNIPKPESKKIDTSFRKYLMIKPSSDNMNIEFEDGVDNESIMLATPRFAGQVVTPVGDKKEKFKLRLTSKGTGRKIDVNFSFTSEHRLPPSDIPNGVNVTRNNAHLGADEDEWFYDERDRELDEEFSEY